MPTVHNPALDSSLCRLQSCSPIVSASAAARRLRPRFSCCSRARLRHPLQLLLPLCLRFQLLLPDCARFICCSPLASASAAAPDCVHFSCYSPIASASTAAPRLRPLRLLLPDCGFQPMPGPEHSSQSSRFSK